MNPYAGFSANARSQTCETPHATTSQGKKATSPFPLFNSIIIPQHIDPVTNYVLTHRTHHYPLRASPSFTQAPLPVRQPSPAAPGETTSLSPSKRPSLESALKLLPLQALNPNSSPVRLSSNGERLRPDAQRLTLEDVNNDDNRWYVDSIDLNNRKKCMIYCNEGIIEFGFGYEDEVLNKESEQHHPAENNTTAIAEDSGASGVQKEDFIRAYGDFTIEQARTKSVFHDRKPQIISVAIGWRHTKGHANGFAPLNFEQKYAVLALHLEGVIGDTQVGFICARNYGINPDDSSEMMHQPSARVFVPLRIGSIVVKKWTLQEAMLRAQHVGQRGRAGFMVVRHNNAPIPGWNPYQPVPVRTLGAHLSCSNVLGIDLDNPSKDNTIQKTQQAFFFDRGFRTSNFSLDPCWLSNTRPGQRLRHNPQSAIEVQIQNSVAAEEVARPQPAVGRRLGTGRAEQAVKVMQQEIKLQRAAPKMLVKGSQPDSMGGPQMMSRALQQANKVAHLPLHITSVAPQVPMLPSKKVQQETQHAAAKAANMSLSTSTGVLEQQPFCAFQTLIPLSEHISGQAPLATSDRLMPWSAQVSDPTSPNATLPSATVPEQAPSNEPTNPFSGDLFSGLAAMFGHAPPNAAQMQPQPSARPSDQAQVRAPRKPKVATTSKVARKLPDAQAAKKQGARVQKPKKEADRERRMKQRQKVAEKRKEKMLGQERKNAPSEAEVADPAPSDRPPPEFTQPGLQSTADVPEDSHVLQLPNRPRRQAHRPQGWYAKKVVPEVDDMAELEEKVD